MSRSRLSKEDARELILKVSENRFENNGLDGLKLADIAREAGITHPNILHHFGSRDGLHAALMERLTTRLATEILENITESATEPDRVGNLGTLFETLSQKGHARLLVWLLSANKDGGQEKGLITSLQPLLDQLQIGITDRYPGEHAQNKDNIRYFLLLVITAAIGDGVAGGLIKQSLRLQGDDTPFDHKAYLHWMAETVLP